MTKRNLYKSLNLHTVHESRPPLRRKINANLSAHLDEAKAFAEGSEQNHSATQS